jgi:sensor histidine kinase YesM
MREMGRGELGRVSTDIPGNELGYVVKQFNEMSMNISELVKKNELMQKEKLKSEMEVLQAQINPHFLYNTLNMIKWMAAVMNAENIVQSIVALGNILSPVFKSDEIMWTVRQELEYVDNYMKIMNWRFGKRIEFVIEADERLLDSECPKFVIQPLMKIP